MKSIDPRDPAWARMLAEATSQILARGSDYLSEHKGLYHLVGDGSASRLEWAHKILELDPHREEQVCQEILPALTSDFPARRPLFSALNCDHFAATFTLASTHGYASALPSVAVQASRAAPASPSTQLLVRAGLGSSSVHGNALADVLL